MRLVVIGLLVVAVLVAGGTAYLIRSYLAGQEAAIEEQTIRVTQVLVAKNNLPLGTRITKETYQWVDWPEENISAEFYRIDQTGNIEKELAGSYVRRAIVKGEPISRGKIFRKPLDGGYLAGALREGYRVGSIKVTGEHASQGFILPGDHVDVVLVHDKVRAALNERRDGKDDRELLVVKNTSETILKNVRVLALDQQTNEFQGQALVAKTYALEVRPKEAEILEVAKVMGRLSLVLRALSDQAEGVDSRADLSFTTDVEASPLLSNLDEMMENALVNKVMERAKKAPASDPDAKAAAPKAKPAPSDGGAPGGGITIYRGATGG